MARFSKTARRHDTREAICISFRRARASTVRAHGISNRDNAEITESFSPALGCFQVFACLFKVCVSSYLATVRVSRSARRKGKTFKKAGSGIYVFSLRARLVILRTEKVVRAVRDIIIIIRGIRGNFVCWINIFRRYDYFTMYYGN